MNNLCTLLTNLAKNNTIKLENLDDLSNLIATVVRDDLGSDSKSLITNWVDNNGDYIDFSFALRPDWLVGTPDDKQVKMRISIDTHDQSWYAYMVMDCVDGEIESWGEKEFTRAELEEYSMPVKSMLEVIHEQYDKKFQEENAKSDADLDKATQVAKQLQKHVDAIKKLCKENKLNIYSDHSIDGTSCLYLVPDGMRCLDDDNSGETIDLEKIPYLDFDACGFDPNYDFFHKVK
jgi:hypothetical protein